MNELLNDRPALRAVVNRIVDLGGEGLLVRRRDFQECIRENGLTVLDAPMSTTQLKRSLNWLISNGCLVRIRYEVTLIDGELRQTRLQVEERMDYYSSLTQYWEFCPRNKFWDLTKSDSRNKVPYFAS